MEMIKELKTIEDVPVDVYYLWNKVVFQEKDKVLSLTSDFELVVLYESKDRFVIEFAESDFIGLRDRNGLTIIRQDSSQTFIPLTEGKKQIKLIDSEGIIIRCEVDNSWFVNRLSFTGSLICKIDISDSFFLRRTDENILLFSMPNNDIVNYRLSDCSKQWHINLGDLFLKKDA
jgi:hypothetical protein